MFWPYLVVVWKNVWNNRQIQALLATRFYQVIPRKCSLTHSPGIWLNHFQVTSLYNGPDVEIAGSVMSAGM